jgi:hypothetical protein
MNTKEAKALRGQVRIAVKEMMKEILTEELVKNIHSMLQKHMDSRLQLVADQVKTTMDTVDQRSKDGLSYLIRQSAPPAPVVPTEGPQATTPTENQQ